jgi:hypothetical protein
MVVVYGAVSLPARRDSLGRTEITSHPELGRPATEVPRRPGRTRRPDGFHSGGGGKKLG